MDEPAIGLGGSSVASLARLHGADTTVAEVIGSELYLVAQAARLMVTVDRLKWLIFRQSKLLPAKAI